MVPAPFPFHRWADEAPSLAVLPETTEEVVAIVKLANGCASRSCPGPARPA